MCLLLPLFSVSVRVCVSVCVCIRTLLPFCSSWQTWPGTTAHTKTLTLLLLRAHSPACPSPTGCACLPFTTPASVLGLTLLAWECCVCSCNVCLCVCLLQLSPMGGVQQQQQAVRQQPAASSGADPEDPEKIRVVVRKRPMNRKVSVWGSTLSSLVCCLPHGTLLLSSLSHNHPAAACVT